MRQSVTAIARASSQPQGILKQGFVSTSPYSVSPDDQVLTFIAGASVANLPPLSLAVRRPIWLINASSVTLTVNAHAGDTLDGAASLSLGPGARFQIMPNA